MNGLELEQQAREVAAELGLAWDDDCPPTISLTPLPTASPPPSSAVEMDDDDNDLDSMPAIETLPRGMRPRVREL